MIVKYNRKKYTLTPDMTVWVTDNSVFSAKPNWVMATIIDLLSIQFTAVIHDTEIQKYCQYSDVGRSWKPMEEGE